MTDKNTDSDFEVDRREFIVTGIAGFAGYMTAGDGEIATPMLGFGGKPATTTTTTTTTASNGGGQFLDDGSDDDGAGFGDDGFGGYDFGN